MDHRMVFEAVLGASRPTNECSVTELLAYETLSETDWAIPSGDYTFIPNVYIDISEHLETKLTAMAFYNSQLKPVPNTRSLESLKSLARLRGGTVGVQFAEAFMLVRQIEK